MNSVLVDFYNLHLRSDLGINNPPNEEERQRIITFFGTYAPNVVRKLTDQRKQQIQDFFCCDLTEKMAKEVLQNKDQEDINSLVLECNINLINKEKLVKTTQLFDAFTTLEGYEVRNRISWFESYGFENFAVEYHRIKELIDKHLDDDKCVPTADRDWLQSRINMYLNADLDYRMIVYLEDYLALNSQDNLKAFFNKHLTKILQFGLHLREIFPSIHKKAMSVLKKELTLRYCNAQKTQKSSACKNIFMPQAKGKKQQYCSKKCANRARRREYYLKHGK